MTSADERDDDRAAIGIDAEDSSGTPESAASACVSLRKIRTTPSTSHPPGVLTALSACRGRRSGPSVIRAVSSATFSRNTSDLPQYNTDNGRATAIAAEVPALQQDADEVLVLPPMDRTGGWDAANNFSAALGVDGLRSSGAEVSRSGGWVVTLEARAGECVAVALSPLPRHAPGKTYVAHLGAARNLHTVLRRHTPDGGAVECVRPSRVCVPHAFVRYWVVLRGGRFSAGVGAVVGEGCVATLDDALYDALRSGTDACGYAGVGNSALGRGAGDIRVRRLCMFPCPEDLVVREEEDFVKVSESAQGASEGYASLLEERLTGEYAQECAKVKRRAEKFGVPAEMPDVGRVLKWSEARVLVGEGRREGFITGLDVHCEEEKKKREERARRFTEEAGEVGEMAPALTAKKRGRDDDDNDNYDGDENREYDEGPLPGEQAWDNEEALRKHRVDISRTSGEEEEGGILIESDVPVPEKIHLFCIDWAAFKQMRNEDLLEHFSDYGPSCIEWLGEFSCNVIFEDRHTASRALAALSSLLPHPPPDSPDLAAHGWRLGTRPVRKVQNDAYGRRGSNSRILMRVAAAGDVLEERPERRQAPPPGFSTTKVLGPGSEFAASQRQGHGRRKRRRRSTGDDYAGCQDDGMGESKADEATEQEETPRRKKIRHRRKSDGNARNVDSGKVVRKIGRLHRDREKFQMDNHENNRSPRKNKETATNHQSDEPQGLGGALKTRR